MGYVAGLSFSAAYFESEQEQAVRDSIDGEQSEIVGLQVDGYELELKVRSTIASTSQPVIARWTEKLRKVGRLEKFLSSLHLSGQTIRSVITLVLV